MPGWRAKIPHASQPKNQNIKQKQYCNKFNEDLKKKKNGPHLKKKSMGFSQSSSKRETDMDTGPPQEIKKVSNKQPNPPSKGIRKEEQTNPKVSRGKEK